ncbi:phosphate ABC transporter permease subunit PstC [Corticibacterium sp. UT-5YL-CI-8]|nr:phosphate ABC transporter permease subunit PstC [Tianweitania sp. UT-5YL-CI-8]
MNSIVIILLLLALLSVGYQVGLSRGRTVAATAQRTMHSRPNYHGLMVALWCIVPAAVVLLLWAVFSNDLTTNYILSFIPSDVAGDPNLLREAMRRIEQIAAGFGVIGETQAWEVAAGEGLRQFRSVSFWSVVVLAAVLGIAGLLLMSRRIAPRLRARNEFEVAIRVLLIFCSLIAIMTTVGIVASLFSEAMRFFAFVSPIDFFFGTVWNPGFTTSGGAGTGEYGLLPLLWGTIMISAIAMLVAIPVGLLSAIYLAEYASPRVRTVAKPMIEILAGIPSVIYGVFALVTLGPLLSDIGALVGIQIRATSALTAGIAMGLMIVPFVSSLSDDIITQVPRAMRDGSLGIGATKSETIRKVVLPAALPGIVGAFMLAISKAFGETMIVVLAAGNAPILRFNPFDAASTVTVSIVNQLTGDTNFASPQSLVAFALGLTLFGMTLVLNVIALYVVRKYREQYE